MFSLLTKTSLYAFSRTTMANWTIRCAEDWLVPVWEAMRKELLQREVLHADETTVQVLKEKGKAPTTKSYTLSFISDTVLQILLMSILSLSDHKIHEVLLNAFA